MKKKSLIFKKNFSNLLHFYTCLEESFGETGTKEGFTLPSIELLSSITRISNMHFPGIAFLFDPQDPDFDS